jgi:hypothetical protein
MKPPSSSAVDSTSRLVQVQASYSQCLGGGGWLLGHMIDGLQAEYGRVPFADNFVHKVPAELTDEQVLFLADILPTAYEVGDPMDAYDTFADAASTEALKVVLHAEPVASGLDRERHAEAVAL